MNASRNDQLKGPRLNLMAVLAAVPLLLGVSNGEAGQRFGVSGFLGAATTADADVRLRQPGGTDLTFGGVDLPLTRRLSAFGEARVSWADISADLEGGGKLEVQPWTGQLAAGLTFRF
jgi:hypothetical protein